MFEIVWEVSLKRWSYVKIIKLKWLKSVSCELNSHF